MSVSSPVGPSNSQSVRRRSPLGFIGEHCRKGEVEVQILDINKLIEFDDQKFNPKVLVNEPQMRIVLLCLRA